MLVLTTTINSTCCINRLFCSKFNSASGPYFHLHVPLLKWRQKPRTKRNKLVFLKLFQWQCKQLYTQQHMKGAGLIPGNTSANSHIRPSYHLHMILAAQHHKQKARWTAGLDIGSLNAHLPASLNCFLRGSTITLVKGPCFLVFLRNFNAHL